MRFNAPVTVTCLAAALLAGHAAWAAQGVVVSERTTINGTPRTQQIQITSQRMRADVAGPQGPTTVVFDGTKQVLYLITPERKTYSEMTKADVDQMGAQLSGAMAQMQQMLASMPPEQRAQMEAMMKGRGLPNMAAAGAAPRPQYKKGGTQRVGKWTCDVYEIVTDNKKTGELCTVSPQTLGFTAADFEVSRQLATFMRGLIPQGADALFQIGTPQEQGFAGVPVRRVVTVFGQETVSEVTDVSRQEIADSLFAVPAGFTKEALGGMGRAGRGRGANDPLNQR